VPAVASVAIMWILAHAMVREFAVNGILLGTASVLYVMRRQVRQKS